MQKLKVKGLTSSKLLKRDKFNFNDFYNNQITLQDFFQLILKRNITEHTKIYVDFNKYTLIKLPHELIYNFFIRDLLEGCKKFSNQYGVDICYINSIVKNPKDHILHVKRAKKDSIILTPFEFYKLIDSYTHSHINNSVLLTLCNTNKELLLLNIPYEMTFESLQKQFSIEGEYYSPITGSKPKKSDYIRDLKPLTLIEESLILEKNNSNLFPFPKFNRSLSIKKGQYSKGTKSSCTNCRKCISFCPESIYPMFYYHYIKSELEEEVTNLLVNRCTSCGVCNFVCPANLEIFQEIEKFLLSEEVDNVS